MTDDHDKPNPSESSPPEIEKLLEIELMQKRAAWQQSKAKYGLWRALSFLFLFLVILAVLVGFYLFFTSDHRREGNPQTEPAPTSAQE